MGIVLGLGLLAQQAWQGLQAFQQAQTCVARPLYWVAVLAAYIVAYFVQMAAWALIMRSLHAPLTARAVLEGYALAFLPRYIPGSVWGYLSRNEWLAQHHQVSYGLSTTASLMEAALLLVTATWIGALYWLPTLWSTFLLPVGIVLLGALAVAMVWTLTPRLAQRLTKKATTGMQTRRHTLGLLSATTLLYAIFWTLQGLALVAIAQTVCGGMALTPFAAIAASAVAWAIGFLILFVPAGLGVREWTLGALLVAFAAIQPGQATLLAVISRFGMVVAEIVVLTIGLHTQIINRWRKRKWTTKENSID